MRNFKPILINGVWYAQYESYSNTTMKTRKHVFNDFLGKKLPFNDKEHAKGWCNSRNAIDAAGLYSSYKIW